MDLYLLATFILGSSVWLVHHVSIDDLLTHRRELDSVLREWAGPGEMVIIFRCQQSAPRLSRQMFSVCGRIAMQMAWSEIDQNL